MIKTSFLSSSIDEEISFEVHEKGFKSKCTIEYHLINFLSLQETQIFMPLIFF